MRLNSVRALVDIGGRETQNPEAGADQEVLPAIVFDKSLSMVQSVVLEHQTRRGVIEIGPADESSFSVPQTGLDLRSRESRLQQQPAKSRLHRGFSGRREPGEQTKAPHPAVPSLELNECHLVGELGPNRRINRDQSLYSRPPKAEVAQSSVHSRHM
jgi:hypothetical protein